MRYCTLEDVKRAIPEYTLIQLTADDPAAEKPNEQVLADALRYGEELVDGYLVARYVLPLSPVPTVVRDAVLYLARYWLYQRRPEGAIPEAVKEGYKETLDLLMRIQKGAVSVGTPAGQDMPEPGVFKISAPKPLFGRDTLEKWR
ncbi:hypothetical protein YP72344_02160 [Yersinia pseudotuberculosis]|uniref:gp436 family protein n=1 Tax=Yersinia pseudotuberculosis complex TaxID=1649845 RepID=UPI00061C6BB1|nr:MULTISPECIES: DUF1320 domain-containing protein [Yersinia pseudotuberculosis complex]MBO1554564.1 DUF1320 domain-containing protein [Yersinia pseudotuberculosis]CNC37541.1 Mu-like prophage protein gp36 [Yersinia similis]CRY70830.1 Mu-like prophage protein gp36 [Yersinia pseudotuberculosis]SUQ18060.1 Mu-like prophage protein gp36 [Yersinia pseudotuberculosis]BCU88721.1 hypothetical protein YP72344_02160 [Yersinia pseudotuberculosis]